MAATLASHTATAGILLSILMQHGFNITGFVYI